MLRGDAELGFSLCGDQAIIYPLVKPKCNKHVPQMLFPLVNRIAHLGWKRIGHVCGWDPVVTIDPGDLFEHIGESDGTGTDIETVRGYFGLHTAFRNGASGFEPGEQESDLFRTQFDPQQSSYILRSQADGRVFGFERIFIHEPWRDRPAGPCCQMLQSAPDSALGKRRMHAA